MKKEKTKNKKIKNSKGITLVALVVTIIILLLLAGITISSLTGSGLFSKTQEAEEKNKKAKIEEDIKLAIMEIAMEEVSKGNNLTLEILANGQLVNKLDGITVTLEDNKIKGEYQGYYYEIDSNLNVTILDKVSGIIFGYSLEPSDGYTNGNIILTLDVSSTDGDITNIEIPNNVTKNENGTYTITQNGEYTFKVTDSTGGTKTGVVNVQKIDKEKPKEFVATIKADSITETGFEIIAETTDAEETETSVQSGINEDRYEYYVNGTKYDTNVITGLQAGTEYTVYVIAYDNAGNDRQTAEITVTTISTKLPTVQEAINEGTALSTTDNTELTDAYGNKIVVPAGFKITSDATTVDKGIVIEDVTNTATKGSQFVWIPVPKSGYVYKDANGTKANDVQIKLDRYTFESDGTPIAQGTATIETYYEELQTSTYGNTTAKSITNFKNSVAENEGYYIGRYEARDGVTASARKSSTNDTNQLVCTASNYVYNYITQPDAAALCISMYTSTEFTSDLINSYAWDTATLFLQECGDNPRYSKQTSLKTGSLATTGTTTDVQCNVFDMASNTREWTTETSSNSGRPCVARGGYYFDSTNYTSIRTNSKTSYSYDFNSFRPLLYL